MKNIFAVYIKSQTNNQTAFWRGYSLYATQYTLLAAWEQLDTKISEGRSYCTLALIVAPISEAHNGDDA